MVDYYNCKMSGSEEEFEPQTKSNMSKAELRRNNKPIMEKRRRARINQCLDELKSLILEAMKKDPTRHSKLEKADILEMTVKHLQTVQRQQLSTAVATDPAVLTKFRSGFSECATEVSRYVSHLENVDPGVKQRLVSHLNNCVSNLQQMAPFYGHYVPYMPERLYPEVKVGFQSDFQNGDENNNGSARIQIPNGVQLIPSRLPTGELALLVPQSANISTNFTFFPPMAESTSRNCSAFTAVHRSQSPLLSPSSSTSSCGEENHQAESHSPNHTQQQQQQHRQHHKHRFKLPEQNLASMKNLSSSSSSSSSPESQKPQNGSTNDRKSPIPSNLQLKSASYAAIKEETTLDVVLDESTRSLIANSLRQPLSVITDKTYNRTIGPLLKRDSLKSHSSSNLLTISGKRARYHEPSGSNSLLDSSGKQESKDDVSSVDDSSGIPTGSAGQHSSDNSVKLIANMAGPSGTNGDMWRPW